MQNDAVIVGLDIGTTKVCDIVGKRNEFGKIEVLGMGKAESLGVIRGEVRNIDKTVKSINEAIERAKQSMEKMNNIRLDYFAIFICSTIVPIFVSSIVNTYFFSRKDILGCYKIECFMFRMIFPTCVRII